MANPNFETIASLVYVVMLWQILKLLLTQDQPRKKIKVKAKLKAKRERKAGKNLPQLNYEILQTENTTETKTENLLERNHPAKKLKSSKKNLKRTTQDKSN